MPATTMCPMNCHPTLCGMSVTVTDGGIRIEGNPDNPDSRGYLCMRGRAAHEIVGNSRRLLQPRSRATPADPWQAETWDGALDRIARAMQRAGREAVGFWQGHGNAVNDYGIGVKRGQMERFANLYGCQYWDPAMICWGLGSFGLGLTGALRTTSKEEMGALSDLIVLWGANSVSQAHTIRHVEEAKRRGARVVTIDVRKTEAGAMSDEVILVRPGTDADLALAMMHVILRDGLEDAAYLQANAVGLGELRVHVRQFDPGWAEARTGVPADRIEAFARLYASADPALIVLGGSSIHKGGNTWAAARAISCLPALVGSYGRPGGGLGPRHGARSDGAGFADIRAADRRPPGDYVPNQMERIVEAMETGRLRILCVVGSNLLSSFPDTNRLARALGNLDLIVAYDIFENDLIRQCAHVVLPGTIWLEELGAKATNGHVHLCERVLLPEGQARPVFELYRGLADRLGVSDVYPWPHQEAAIDAVLDHPATGRATVAALRAAGGSLPLRVSSTGHGALDFDTPSGRIEFRSDRAAEMGLPPLPVPSETGDPGLRLATGRTFAHFHAFFDHGAALPALAARESGPTVWLSPPDAEARGIGDGDAVELFNVRGRFRARANVTRRIPKGTVWCRDGWLGLNALTDGAAVLPDAALGTFAFSVGQSHFGATVEIRRTGL